MTFPGGGGRFVRTFRSLAVTLSLLAVPAVAFALPRPGRRRRRTSPLLECVFHDTGTGQYNAAFGYNTSSRGTTCTDPIGSLNAFSPSPAEPAGVQDQPVPIVAPQTLRWLTVGAAGVGMVVSRRQRALAALTRTPDVG